MKKDIFFEKIKKYMPYIIMALSFILLIVRSFYSFCWSDEPFYFATADRFYKGDRIFVDDWFPTQLSGVFILPLYSLFVKITGSAAGVILFFRITYVIFELAAGLVIYRLLKDISGNFTALSISLFTVFYTHLNIATISYYTMSVHFFLLAMVLIYNYYRTYSEGALSGKIKLFLAGVCFALSVLNLPTLAAAYVLIVAGGFVLCFAAKIFKIKNAVLESLKLPMVFKYTLAGILPPAVIFVIYLLMHISIPELIKAIPYVLSDDEHITSKVYPVKKMYLSIMEAYGNKIFYLGCVIAALAVISWILSIACSYIKVSGKCEKLYKRLTECIPVLNTVIVVSDLMAFVLYFYKSFGHTGYIQTAVMMFSVPLFFITHKKDAFAFILFFLSGITFSLVYSYSSTGMLYVLAMGHFIASVGGIIFIKDFLTEYNDEEHINKIISPSLSTVMSLIIIVSIVHTVSCRFTNIYRDDKLSMLTEAITSGPAKHLKTSRIHKQMYDEVYDVLTNQINGGENILISKLLPWGYLCNDLKNSAPTAWRNGMDNDRIREYYELNPDKEPDVILVLDDYYGTYETCGDVEYDPNPNLNADSGYVYDYIKEKGFDKKEVICGTLYYAPQP